MALIHLVFEIIIVVVIDVYCGLIRPMCRDSHKLLASNLYFFEYGEKKFIKYRRKCLDQQSLGFLAKHGLPCENFADLSKFSCKSLWLLKSSVITCNRVDINASTVAFQTMCNIEYALNVAYRQHISYKENRLNPRNNNKTTQKL